MPPILPPTSSEHYLTGTAALSIPTEEGDVADWHFDATFLQAGTRFRVAGNNFPSTKALLGDFGVRECSTIMRERAVSLPEMATFYAASYPRAVLDLVLTTTERHQSPAFLRADEVLQEGDFNAVMDRLDSIRERITDTIQRNLIDQWISEQRQNANISQ